MIITIKMPTHLCTYKLKPTTRWTCVKNIMKRELKKAKLYNLKLTKIIVIGAGGRSKNQERYEFKIKNYTPEIIIPATQPTLCLKM